MKRLIDYHLLAWKKNPQRRPLLLRGARQVGKTYAVRNLGATFSSFVEINFESNKKARALFDQDFDSKRILSIIAVLTEKPIIPGETLLFFDEIQAVPEGVTALRYFYEEMPELHIIAAGSLLDFALEAVGVPVGRVQFLYLYPLSFIEFLSAFDKNRLAQQILSHPLDQEQEGLIHEAILNFLGLYLAVGGMPQAVMTWKQTQNIQETVQILQSLIEAYRYDFVKYGKSRQINYLEILFAHIPQQFGKKFKYGQVGELRRRELEPCVRLLATAGVIHEVHHTDAQGIPLGAQVDLDTFKLLFIDGALSQCMLDFKAGDWLLNPLAEFVNKGALVEAFIGQELLAYDHPTKKAKLYYWRRDARGSEAEVDYIIQAGRSVIPVEVKSGKGTTLKSMQLFLESHKESPYGIRFSINNYSVYEKIHSYPLYAVAPVIAAGDEEVMNSLIALVE